MIAVLLWLGLAGASSSTPLAADSPRTVAAASQPPVFFATATVRERPVESSTAALTVLGADVLAS
ncbi:MAG: hypothetical protein MI919_16515, partial [Holophagales bacterium]|nr:hypothetical protein [Holophagales bacterium]